MSLNNSKYKAEEGFSLLELMISLIIFLVVISAIWGLITAATSAKSLTMEKTTLNKSERVALNLISRDTYNAGFGVPLTATTVLPDNRIGVLLETPVDADTTRDTISPIMAGNNLPIRVNNLNSDTTVRTDQVTFLFKDSTFNLMGNAGQQVSQPLNINAASTNISTGIDEVVPLSGSNSTVRVNDLLLVTGNTGATLSVVTGKSGSNIIEFANGDLAGFNQTGTSGPLRSITVPASLVRVRMLTYFVTPDGVLTRREYVNTEPPAAVKWVDDQLVYNVQNFQIQYILDDGSITDDPAAGPDGLPGTADDVPSNLLKVRQIRYTITMKSKERLQEGRNLEQSMTTTVSTRNLGYEAN